MTQSTKHHIPEPYATKVRERILANIKDVNGCWEWQKSLSVRGGYSQMMLSVEPKKPVIYAGHRASWLVFRGDVQPGMHIDHLCRNHKCVNPDHLEPVTPQENILRGEVAREGKKASDPVHYCRHGHSMTGDNLYEFKNYGVPRVICNACRKASRERTRLKNIRSRTPLEQTSDLSAA